MQNLVLFDDARHINLLPLTYTRPVSELRLGILKIREKWELQFKLQGSWLTRDYLRAKFAMKTADDNLFINSGLLPSGNLVKQIEQLQKGEALVRDKLVLAARATHFQEITSGDIRKKAFSGEYQEIQRPYELFSLNAFELAADFQRITHGRTSHELPATNGLLNEAHVFAEEGTNVQFATINASTGPVYIGKNAQIMEGAHIRGPAAVMENAVVKMGAKIYSGTTIGPYSKAGGEIKNVIIQGYSNKAHEGYLGDSYIGEWCNLGADTNNSNLKNNYAGVKLWSYNEERFLKTGLTFCGLIMGDHSKSAINTMFNTGTVVGVSTNIYGSGFPRNFIPSFSWGGARGLATFKPEKAFEVASKVFERKGKTLDETEKNLLQKIFEMSAKYRK